MALQNEGDLRQSEGMAPPVNAGDAPARDKAPAVTAAPAMSLDERVAFVRESYPELSSRYARALRGGHPGVDAVAELLETFELKHVVDDMDVFNAPWSIDEGQVGFLDTIFAYVDALLDGGSLDDVLGKAYEEGMDEHDAVLFCEWAQRWVTDAIERQDVVDGLVAIGYRQIVKRKGGAGKGAGDKGNGDQEPDDDVYILKGGSRANGIDPRVVLERLHEDGVYTFNDLAAMRDSGQHMPGFGRGWGKNVPALVDKMLEMREERISGKSEQFRFDWAVRLLKDHRLVCPVCGANYSDTAKSSRTVAS